MLIKLLLGLPMVFCKFPVLMFLVAFLWRSCSWNHGQCCCAGTRIFVQSGIYDEFLQKFTERSKAIKVGDPFAPDTNQGPQVSQIQYDVRIMFFIAEIDNWCQCSIAYHGIHRVWQKARRQSPSWWWSCWQRRILYPAYHFHRHQARHEDCAGRDFRTRRCRHQIWRWRRFVRLSSWCVCFSWLVTGIPQISSAKPTTRCMVLLLLCSVGTLAVLCLSLTSSRLARLGYVILCVSGSDGWSVL